jgi:hypothetical protein
MWIVALLGRIFVLQGIWAYIQGFVWWAGLGDFVMILLDKSLDIFVFYSW